MVWLRVFPFAVCQLNQTIGFLRYCGQKFPVSVDFGKARKKLFDYWKKAVRKISYNEYGINYESVSGFFSFAANFMLIDIN